MKIAVRRQGWVLGLVLMLICINAGAQSNPNASTTGQPATAASTGPTQDPEAEPEFPDDMDNDPFEGFNRAIYKFNDYVDRGVLKPVARAYDKVMPGFVKKVVSNFFRNLFEPTVIINDVLQAKFKQTASDTARFIVNTTAGIGGFFDVASHVQLPAHNEDFGQTLGYWGIGEGPFIVWPFFGPRNVRDSFGMAVDWYTDPITYIESDKARWGLRVLQVIDTRTQLLKASTVLEQATDDQYLFVREAYRQRRRNLIYDGAPPPQ